MRIPLVCCALPVSNALEAVPVFNLISLPFLYPRTGDLVGVEEQFGSLQCVSSALEAVLAFSDPFLLFPLSPLPPLPYFLSSLRNGFSRYQEGGFLSAGW